MIYYASDDLIIRDLTRDDAKVITEEEIRQGWHATIDKYLKHLKDVDDGVCISLVLEYKGCPAGYINIYHHSIEGPLNLQGLPEIVDFGVLEKYRCKGFGTLLMNQAEMLAKKYADKVYLSVGLHKGYGSAQRMYIKRGYIPDGTGVWYNSLPLDPYKECINDDDLQIYLYKNL